ncbi:MAG: putative Ig domain-containing protein, partial [Phycisphaerales bacterium]
MLTGKSENPVISSAKRNSTKYRLHLMILCLTLAINVALPDFCSTATYGNPILAPGSGFTGLTSEPGPIGTSGQGYDAKAIARWDVVPYQTFNDTFHIGVVAFHMIGIDRVEFSVDGGPWHNVSEMTSNPRTGVVEYWATLEASDFSDGLIEVRAIAYPTIGQPRLLDSLYLYANAGNTLPIGNTVYIKTTGNDSNNGSMSSPMRTITNAIDAAGDGGKVIILDEGLYELHSTQQRRAFFFRNERYITVEASAGLNRDNVIIGWPIRQQSRPKVGKMHFKGVSFDFSTISQYYLGGYVWFEKCRWFQSDGWATSYSDLRIPVRKAGDIYITDSLAEDMIYGFVSAKLVRNSTTQKISGDAYQNSQMVLNCRAVNINGDILSHHTDIYQIWGQNENFIVYGLDTDNIVKTQCMFLDHDNSSHINYAFVNIYFDCFDPGGSPPHTQFNAAHNHVIFRNVRWPGQQISFRDDFAGEKKFTANNVIFENCELYPENYDRYVLRKYSWGRGTPEGVTFDNCYPSTGSASPVLDAIGNKFINENSTLTFDVNATDPEGASVAIYNKGLPSGATFSNWTFSWTPSYYQAGDYEVTFTASDGRNYDSETITITVNNVNRPPVLDAISDRSVNENALLSFSVNATDPDGEAITYSVSGLPTGAVFAGQTFTWTPSYIQAGSHNIKFTASDGMAEDSQVMTITVNNVNIAPALTSIGNKSVYASQLLTFSVHATDFDGGSITYSATGMPSGATFASQTFNWTPNSSQAGTHDVTFIANDGENLNSETITITVDIDTLAPTVTNCSPNNDAIQVPLNNIISLSITDADTGVDADSVTIRLNSNIIYTGDTNHYKSSNGNCHRKGTTANYTFIYQSNETFDYDQTMAITVNATDIAENSMTEYSSSFATEMRAFGKNKRINSATKLDSDKPVTVCDSNGNI